MSGWYVALGYFTVGICLSTLLTALVYRHRKSIKQDWERGDNVLAVALVALWPLIIYVWVRGPKR